MTRSISVAKTRLRRYLYWAAGTVIVALCGVACLNVLIDPYWIHRGPFSTYWHPVERQHCSRIAKSELARQDPVDVAILGDSRALWGLDPRHPAFESLGVAYNLGMIGASIHEASRLLDVLLSRSEHTPKAIIWLLQPEFVVLDRRPQQNFDYRQSRLDSNIDQTQTLMNSLWGNETTSQSINLLISSLRDQRPVIVRGYTEKPVSRSPLHHEVFLDFREQQKVYISKSQGALSTAEMESVLDRQMNECSRRGIQVHLIVPPSHALYWQLLEEDGWGDRVENGKRCLTRIATAANADIKSPMIHVWDFSGFEGPSAEAPPMASVPKRMQYHSDAVHFTKTMGDLIISRLMNDPSGLADSKFGVELTEQNIDAHLSEWKLACREYGKHPADAAGIASKASPVAH